MRIKNANLLETLSSNGDTDKISAVFDSRPEFNGEFKAFITLSTIFDLEFICVVGARDDFFYLQSSPSSTFLLIEPSITDLEKLKSYTIKKGYSQVYLTDSCIWSEKGRKIELYPGGTCYPISNQNEYESALSSGKIIDPYYKRESCYIRNKEDTYCIYFDHVRRSNFNF